MKKITKKVISVILAITIALTTVLATVAASNECPIDIEITTNKEEYGTLGKAKFVVEVTNKSNQTVENVSAEAVFDELDPFGFGSEISAEDSALEPGETLRFEFKASLDAKKMELNFIQRILLKILRCFHGDICGFPDEDFDDGRAMTSNTHKVTFGKYEVEQLVEVWYEANEEDEKNINIDRSSFAYNEKKNTYGIYEEAKVIKGTLKNITDACNISFEVVDEKNTVIDFGDIDVAKNWETTEVGFITGKNTLVVTVTYKDGTTASDSVTADCYYNIHEGKLSIDMTSDSDNDGLVDYLENYIGTNSAKKDTDSDGLSDYEEVMSIGTDPSLSDTDEDGKNDFDSDEDNDGLTNGYEISIGTKATEVDSDGDLITDYDEVFLHKTSPISEDTDRDGANDGWEIINGFNPLIYNTFFEAKSSSTEISETNPVSAKVSLSVSGEQATTLDVQPVGYFDNPLLSTAIPGYLGTAYDFSIDGEFSEAIITFEYDTNLGEISDEFQPRIYFFNEEDGTFEELENQVVSEGKVSVKVTHFSKYILLNKVDFDKVWDTEIKAPDYQGSGMNGLDIVFVVDSSGSMDWNDETNIRHQVVKKFVDKLGEKDRAAVVDFDNYSTVYQNFTSDHDLLYSAIDKVNSSGGTNLSSGMSAAINLFTSSSYTRSDAYKYIVFLTDGDGSYSSSYTTSAYNNGITVYTVGLGEEVQESVLKQIAEGTGGKYYFASTANDLEDIYLEIEDETIDYSTDTNKDGISDYYTNLICSGKLRLSNGSDEFEGIDFNYDDEGNVCADADGDGLKNGEEICIVENGNRVYAIMKSNPLMVHSDSDLIDDYDEVRNGSNPLVYQASSSTVNALCNNNGYNYESAIDDYENNWLFHADTEFLAAIYGVWNKDELYRDLLIDYFANYGESTYIKSLETEATKKYMVESLASVVSNIKKYWASPRGEISKICKLISQINGTADYETIRTIMYSSYTETVVEIFEMNPQLGTFSFTSYTVSKETTVLVNLTNVSKGIDKVSKGLSYAAYGLDVADTITKFAKVSANMEAFDQNADILRKMANESTNDHARNAANSVLNSLGGSMGTEILKAVGSDVILDIAANELIGFIAKKNVYVLAFVVIRDGLNLLTGIKTDLQQQYRMDLYSKLSDAIILLVKGVTYNDGTYVYIYNDDINDFTRLMTNLAQVRILGEKMYCDWQENDGVLGWFTDNSDVEALIAEQVKSIKNLAIALNLTLSPSL